MEVESDFEMILNYFEEFNIGEIFFIQLNVLTFDCLRRKTLFSIDFSNMFNCTSETSVRTNNEAERTSTSKKIQFMSMHYKWKFSFIRSFFQQWSSQRCCPYSLWRDERFELNAVSQSAQHDKISSIIIQTKRTSKQNAFFYSFKSLKRINRGRIFSTLRRTTYHLNSLQSAIVTVFSVVPLFVPASSIFFNTSKPSITSPNTTWKQDFYKCQTWKLNSIIQLLNSWNSTIQVFNYPIIQLFKFSAIELFKFSTIELFNYWTIELFNFSTIQLFNYSTFQLFNNWIVENLNSWISE